MLIKYFISKIYFSFFCFVAFLYKAEILKSHVFENNTIISIGNLSVGGSGKTPLVVSLSKILTNLSIPHAIVSRGYKKKSTGEVVVSDGYNIVDDCLVSGDEPLMLASLLPGVPVVVGDKIKAIKKVNELKKYKTIIIDDGFQTFKIKKDLDILLLDLSKDKKDYQLLPLGKLREPLSGVSRSDVVVFTKNIGPSSDQLKSFLDFFIDSKKQLVLESSSLFSLLEFKNDEFLEVEGLVQVPVVSFSGIENSTSFIKEVNRLFSNISHNLIFKDHCEYNKTDIMKIKNILVEKNIASIVTTMKDFVKIKTCFQNIRIFVLHVDYQILKKDNLINQLSKYKN